MNLARIAHAAIERAAYSTGLSLTPDQIRDIAETENACLAEHGRISFGKSAAEQIVLEFSESPFITGGDSAKTFIELTEAFFEVREDLPARFTDAEIIEALKEAFDGDAAGDAALAAALARDSLSKQHESLAYEIADDYGKVYRWDPAEWHEDVMADGWYGERWDADYELPDEHRRTH